MILSTSGGDSESSSSLCSCYAPITLHNNKSGAWRESKKATSPVNGHSIGPVGQQLPPPPPLPSPLKSNLKKPIRVEEQKQQQQQQQEAMVRDGRRKVSWPDAHGRDLAHVQVFHSRGICGSRQIPHLQHSVMGVALQIALWIDGWNHLKRYLANQEKSSPRKIILAKKRRKQGGLCWCF